MKTQEQILEAVKAGKGAEAIDGRDYSRLVEFFPIEDWDTFGFELKKGIEHEPKPWAEESVMEQFQKDVAFGFEKALDQRGISASCMNSVVKMWLWVLDDPLHYNDEYAQYGLPLLKKVAVKYDFPNEIGDDYGNESQYAA